MIEFQFLNATNLNAPFRFEAILREWNQFRTRRSLELAQETLRLFYIDVNNLDLRSDVHVKRVIMDVQNWQREVEQMFQGFCT